MVFITYSCRVFYLLLLVLFLHFMGEKHDNFVRRWHRVLDRITK